MNTPEEVITLTLGLSKFQWGACVAAFAIGGFLGSQIGGDLADRLGRRRFLGVNSLFFVVAGALLWLSGLLTGTPAFIVFGVARIIVGLGAGAGSVVVPMYLTEVAPANLRGAFGACNQGAIVFGIIVSNLLGLVDPLVHNPGWRYLLALTAPLGVLQFFLVPCISRSPSYLISHGDEAECRVALHRLRGSDSDVDRELELLQRDSIGSADGGEKSSVSWSDVINDKSIRLPLLMMFALHIGQQLSGINGMIQYSTGFFKDAHVTPASMGTLYVGIVNAAATAVSIYLIDRKGRRFLILLSATGMMVSCAAVTICLIAASGAGAPAWLHTASLVGVLLFVAFFAVGLGPIPWQVGGEMFPDKSRATAMGMGASVNWTCTFIISIFFPILNTALGNYVFVPFGVVLVTLIAVVLRWLPETRGRSIREVLRDFRRKAGHAEEELHSGIV